jgi:hypothetical protein
MLPGQRIFERSLKDCTTGLREPARKAGVDYLGGDAVAHLIA